MGDVWGDYWGRVIGEWMRGNERGMRDEWVR